MYEKVPISGIRESYCPASGPRTVVMPLLILAVLAGLIAFYFKGNPAPTEAALVVTQEPAEPIAPDAKTPATDLVSLPLAGPTVPDRSPPLLTRTDVSEKDFTPWMSSLALETYIRQKNRGYQGSFWSRGNWIRAVEGRWNEGAREFRIALGTMTRPGEIQWQYRLDMTEIAFAEELARMGDKGFNLVQSQAFRHSDGKSRYQAVWQRGEDAQVAGR